MLSLTILQAALGLLYVLVVTTVLSESEPGQRVELSAELPGMDVDSLIQAINSVRGVFTNDIRKMYQEVRKRMPDQKWSKASSIKLQQTKAPRITNKSHYPDEPRAEVLTTYTKPRSNQGAPYEKSASYTTSSPTHPKEVSNPHQINVLPLPSYHEAKPFSMHHDASPSDYRKENAVETFYLNKMPNLQETRSHHSQPPITPKETLPNKTETIYKEYSFDKVEGFDDVSNKKSSTGYSEIEDWKNERKRFTFDPDYTSIGGLMTNYPSDESVRALKFGNNFTSYKIPKVKQNFTFPDSLYYPVPKSNHQVQFPTYEEVKLPLSQPKEASYVTQEPEKAQTIITSAKGNITSSNHEQREMERSRQSGNTGYGTDSKMDTSDDKDHNLLVSKYVPHEPMPNKEPTFETRRDQNAELNEVGPLSTADLIESVEPHFLSLFPALSAQIPFPSFSEVWHRRANLS